MVIQYVSILNCYTMCVFLLNGYTMCVFLLNGYTMCVFLLNGYTMCVFLLIVELDSKLHTVVDFETGKISEIVSYFIYV